MTSCDDPMGTLFDPVSCRHLDALGVGAGWRCWEVGDRRSALPAWLADRVGDTGRVLATGLDATPAESFDLVHARMVLACLSDRHEALRRMVQALRPGGWLVVEELDIDFQPCATPDASNAEQYLSNRIRAGLLALLGQRGVDFELGRKLPRLLREVGLVDVAADGYFPLALPAAAALEVANIERERDDLIELRAASGDQIDLHLGAAREGSVDVGAPPLISAWGRVALSPD